MKLSVTEFISELLDGNIELAKNSIIVCSNETFFCEGEIIYNFFMVSELFDDIYCMKKVSDVIKLVNELN